MFNGNNKWLLWAPANVEEDQNIIKVIQWWIFMNISYKKHNKKQVYV